MSIYEFRFNGHSMQYKVKQYIYLAFYCSSMTSKLKKGCVKPNRHYPILPDARALLTHGASYQSRSWKIQYCNVYSSGSHKTNATNLQNRRQLFLHLSGTSCLARELCLVYLHLRTVHSDYLFTLLSFYLFNYDY